MTGIRPGQIRRMPAASGFGWLLQSVVLLRAQTGRLLLIALLMQFVLGLTQVPLLGLLVVLCVPGLSAGLLESFHVIQRGGRPDVRTLFRPLGTGPCNGRLLALGALVFAVGVVSMSLLLSGSPELTDPDLVARIEEGDLDAVATLDQGSLRRMALAFLIGVSVSGTLSYFAIPLVWFHRQKLGPALAVGLRGLIVNWRPFLLLGLGLMLFAMPLALLTGLLFTWSGSGGLPNALVMGLIMLVLLLFQLMLFGTQYCAFRDIFGLEVEDSRPEDDEGQLVA